MSRRPPVRVDPSRPWLGFGVDPPQPAKCDGCGAANAPLGIGPPLRPRRQHYCASCNERQPETQASIAERAREAIEE